MKNLIACLFVLVCTAQIAAAQEEDEPSLMERGAQQFLEGLLQEMAPALDGMRDFVDEMGPALIDLMEEIKDWSNYEAPEVLDNGDIIIRRKPAPETPPVEPGPNIEI